VVVPQYMSSVSWKVVPDGSPFRHRRRFRDWPYDLNAELAMSVARRPAARVFTEHDRSHRAGGGRRPGSQGSGEMLGGGPWRAGARVGRARTCLLLGVCPPPAVAFLVDALGADLAW